MFGCTPDLGNWLMLGRPNTALSQIHMQIMWSRLIAVVEEQAQTLVRTAFSTTVREAGDLSAGVFDRDGNMLAQAVTGTPGHVNSISVDWGWVPTAGRFLRRGCRSRLWRWPARAG